MDAGVEIPAVADLRENGAAEPMKLLSAAASSSLRGATVLEANGRGQLAAASCSARPGAEGGAGERAFGCDLLVVSGGSAPATSLLAQAGARTAYDGERGALRARRAARRRATPRARWRARATLDAAELSGALAGAEAAHALGFGDDASRARGAGRPSSRARRPPRADVAVPPPVTSSSARASASPACART